MTETISRMFALSATDPSRLPECWTDGKGDPQLLSAYAAVGPPASFTADSEHSIARDSVLFAAVRVKASWAGTPPPGWASGEQTFVLRQQRDWSWTIDTAQPRTAEGRRDPHCVMCHGGGGRP